MENDPHGEFIGFNILFEELTPSHDDQSSVVAAEDRFGASREKLFLQREGRPRPHLDNKVLTSWNALMISALVKAGGVLGKPEYTEAGIGKRSNFCCPSMFDSESGALLRRYCEGEAAIPGLC